MAKRIAIVEDEAAIRDNYAAAFRREATSVYSLLESGANLRDGQPLWDVSNSTTQPSALGAIEKGVAEFGGNGRE